MMNYLPKVFMQFWLKRLGTTVLLDVACNRSVALAWNKYVHFMNDNRTPHGAI
jgi:hypothetical protein